jgi:hypothetical protein
MGQMPSWAVSSARLTAEPASAFGAREFVCFPVLRQRLPHLQDDVSLAVSDLVTNATAAAMGGGGRGLVIVDVLSRDWGVLTHSAGSKSVWAAFAAEADVVAAS